MFRSLSILFSLVYCLSFNEDEKVTGSMEKTAPRSLSFWLHQIRVRNERESDKMREGEGEKKCARNDITHLYIRS